jgi:hypothetical protein
LPSVRENNLQEFVDRRDEVIKFRALLENTKSPVMVISGVSGMGKSSLLIRLVAECKVLGISRVEIDCKDARHRSYEKIMRAMAETLGPEHFQRFLDLADHFAHPHRKLKAIAPDINVHAEITAGTINSGAAVTGVVIEQVNISLSGEESQDDRIAALTDRFFEDLEPLLEKKPIVFFFDQVENAITQTRNWIWQEFFRPVRAGGLQAARFVLCVQGSPESTLEVGDLRTLIKRTDLKPLGEEDILDYIVQRHENRFTRDECRMAARLLAQNTKGRPGDVATAVDGLLASQERTESDKRKVAGGS